MKTNDLKFNHMIFERMIDKIYPSKEDFYKLINTKKRIKIYLGIDPTGPHLHLGHATNLIVLKEFQNLGHEIILLIGDFTGRIGDPTDKLSPRQPLTKKMIGDNLKTFKAQASKIISFAGKNPAKLKFNSEWHGKLKFEDVLKIAEHLTVPQLLTRDMFQERFKNGKTVGLNEFLYPLMQGYDSVAMDVDVELGGTDQTFNMLVGRDLMKSLKQKEKCVITTKLLLSKTGEKLMNKSTGGLINLDDSPKDMFGKLMAMDDNAIFVIAELCSIMSDEKIKVLKNEKNPRDAKLKIAEEIISLYHSKKEAKKSREEWIRIFSKKEISEKWEELTVAGSPSTIYTLRRAGIPSNSEAMRLLSQGAVEVDGKIVKDPKEERKPGEKIRIGKKKFFKIK
ncbi:MAG: tyrosine--tRNA ligase [Patescibacteria group bacterium]|nr:tyrosine--tRNA ligase [Patescibacteria group bacterium]